jgi:uncharacterized cupin superfamily protein
MDRANIFEPQLEFDDTDPDGYRAGMDRFGKRIGAHRIGGSVYELAPGQSICPYHYELGDEEWLIVLAGRPTIRHPAGEDVLEPGDTVCFPEGPDGAHKVLNQGDETARVLMVSTLRMPAIAVYPDGDKVGVFPGHGLESSFYRRENTVDYYDREV